MRHRLTNQETICFGSPRRSVHSSAWVLNTPCGSRIRTQRRGTAGSPVLYQMAALELTSIVRSSPPYHSLGDRDGTPSGGRIFSHHRKIGQPPPLEARPTSLTCPARRSRFVERCVQAQSSDESDRGGELAATVEEFQRSVLPIAHSHYLTPRIPPSHQRQWLPGPLCEWLVAQAPLPGVALGVCQRAKER